MVIGMIGLGRMGLAVARRLVARGRPVQAYVRNPQTRLEAAEYGITTVGSAELLASEADVLILCLYHDDQLRELLLEQGLAQQLKPGAVVVVHTTGSPQLAEELGQALAAIEAQLIDAPFSGGPHNIAAGDITLLVGGGAAALQRCTPVLKCYASNIVHLGPLGSGQKVKLVNNLLFAAHTDLLKQADQTLQSLNVDTQQALAAIGHCSGDSRVLQLINRSGDVARFVASAGEFIAKDRATAMQVAHELGLNLGVLAMANLGGEQS